MQNLKVAKDSAEQQSQHARPFYTSEVETAICSLKLGKAAGTDGVFPEFLKNCGEGAIAWLAVFYTNILTSGNIPSLFKRAKIIALLKPGKPPGDPASYRPISLLSISYKLLERLIYNRIEPIINATVPIEQAGFRAGRSCCDQVLALTTYVEDGFQKKQKIGAAFLDLTAAYDTVWRQGLVLKFLKVIPCKMLGNLLNNMLSNRHFQVHAGDDISRGRQLNDGLPQGSVLAPLLFNLYTSDLPQTNCRKFIYADDIVLASRSNEFERCQMDLQTDIASLANYFANWRLKLNLSKTEVTAFHLSNRLADHKLTVSLNGQTLNHNPHPKYLGVTLDRSLTYKNHLTGVAAKVRTRNNIIQKLTGTGWGAGADTLRTSSLALVYSAAEYCAPVWANSSHTGPLDAQLNRTMRLVSGTIKSTPVEWLPVLSNITPPDLRRREATMREWSKCYTNTKLPLHQDIQSDPTLRLKSRKPSWILGGRLVGEGFSAAQAWQDEWNSQNPDHRKLVQDPTMRQPGFDLPRKLWASLNRIRTGHGRCGHLLHKWGKREHPQCECGQIETVDHIVGHCPIKKFEGDIWEIHKVTPRAIEYLRNIDAEL